MGMYAMYQEVKEEDFKKLLESDDFFETIEDLEEKDGTELCDIDIFDYWSSDRTINKY